MITVKLAKETGFYALVISDNFARKKVFILKELYKRFNEFVDQLSSTPGHGEKGCAFSQKDISCGSALLASARVFKRKKCVIEAFRIDIEEMWSELTYRLLARCPIMFEKLGMLMLMRFNQSENSMQNIIHVVTSIKYYPGFTVAVINLSNYQNSYAFELLAYIVRKTFELKTVY